MKRYTLYIIVGLLAFTSCEDVFDTDSTSIVVDNGERIEHPGDSLYSVMGILSQFQRLGERYVLLGELRGELMSTTTDAAKDLQDVANFSIEEGNQYADRMEYYTVINNCNFSLQRMDTSIVDYQSKVMLPEYVAIRAIRGWTYWQMALAFGKVNYIDHPLLSLESTLKDYPVKDIDEVAQLLIDDLTPYLGTRQLDYGSVDGIPTTSLFVPLPLFLADLHLYLNHYAEAAQLYYDYIYQRHLTISEGYTSEWTVNTRANTPSMWHTSSYLGEMLFQMAYNSDAREYHPMLIRLAYNKKPSVVPAQSFVNDMTQRIFFFTQPQDYRVTSYLAGDLRGEGITRSGQYVPGAYGTFTFQGTDVQLIYKYFQGSAYNGNGYDPLNEDTESGLRYTRQIPILRTPHIYLRMAEALNRLGKPSMAFAVLKHGLNEEALTDSLKVAPSELESGEPFLNFSWAHHHWGDYHNVGTASRGMGRGITSDTENYVIGEQTSLEDSVRVVEEMILEEMAAETAFEGNRFFDLLRISRHRDQWPAFAAERVSRRFEDTEGIRQKLNNPNVWWLK